MFRNLIVSAAAAAVLSAALPEVHAVEADVSVTVLEGWSNVFGGQRVFDMGEGYQTTIAWLVRRRIPRSCDWLLARTQWATWADPSGVPDLVELRIHTADNIPYLAEAISSQTISRAVDDELAGFLGAQEYFPPVKVERDAQGWSWIFMSARTNGGAPSTARYSVREWTATPMAASVGFQGQPPGEWGG